MRNIEKTLPRKFHDHQLDISRTSFPGHAFVLAEKAAADKFDIVVAVGGDGTINQVLNGIGGNRVLLGIIPAGTANDLAGHYRIPNDIDSACDIILNGHRQRSDVISVNGWYYLTVGGIGLPSDIIAAAELIRTHRVWRQLPVRLIRRNLYKLALIMTLLRRSIRYGNRIDIEMDGRCINADLLSLIVSNQPVLGKDFTVAPGAVSDDGFLDLVFFDRVADKRHLLKMLFHILRRTRNGRSTISGCRCTDITVNTATPLAFFGDGELSPPATHFEIHIIPAAVNLIVPPTEVRFDAA